MQTKMLKVLYVLTSIELAGASWTERLFGRRRAANPNIPDDLVGAVYGYCDVQFQDNFTYADMLNKIQKSVMLGKKYYLTNQSITADRKRILQRGIELDFLRRDMISKYKSVITTFDRSLEDILQSNAGIEYIHQKSISISEEFEAATQDYNNKCKTFDAIEGNTEHCKSMPQSCSSVDPHNEQVSFRVAKFDTIGDKEVGKHVNNPDMISNKEHTTGNQIINKDIFSTQKAEIDCKKAMERLENAISEQNAFINFLNSYEHYQEKRLYLYDLEKSLRHVMNTFIWTQKQIKQLVTCLSRCTMKRKQGISRFTP